MTSTKVLILVVKSNTISMLHQLY